MHALGAHRLLCRPSVKGQRRRGLLTIPPFPWPRRLAAVRLPGALERDVREADKSPP